MSWTHLNLDHCSLDVQHVSCKGQQAFILLLSSYGGALMRCTVCLTLYHCHSSQSNSITAREHWAHPFNRVTWTSASRPSILLIHNAGGLHPQEARETLLKTKHEFWWFLNRHRWLYGSEWVLMNECQWATKEFGYCYCTEAFTAWQWLHSWIVELISRSWPTSLAWHGFISIRAMLWGISVGIYVHSGNMYWCLFILPLYIMALYNNNRHYNN